jgi:hypothetical protein
MRKWSLLSTAAAAGLVLLQACVMIRVPVPGRPMTRSDALAYGDSYCASHGLRCALKEAHLTGNGIWKVKYSAWRGDARGHVHLEIDAATGALVKVNEKIKDRGGKHDHHEHDHDHDHDDDDDDDDRGRGKGKGKGKD